MCLQSTLAMLLILVDQQYASNHHTYPVNQRCEPTLLKTDSRTLPEGYRSLGFSVTPWGHQRCEPTRSSSRIIPAIAIHRHLAGARTVAVILGPEARPFEQRCFAWIFYGWMVDDSAWWLHPGKLTWNYLVDWMMIMVDDGQNWPDEGWWLRKGKVVVFVEGFDKSTWSVFGDAWWWLICLVTMNRMA